MIKKSLCIEPVLTNIDFYDRIKVAAEIGFDAIEFWDPVDKDVARIGKLAADNKIDVAVCCVRNAWSTRMNFPTSVVVENIKESIKLAKEMGCNSLIALSGDIEDNEGKADFQKNILIENLKRVADILVKENVTIVLEALNSYVDHEGYYLDSSHLGFEIVKSVGCENIKLLYDVYHMQIMEGNLIDNIKKSIEYIGHFHSAGVPGRHELFNGEINYKNILKAIEETGYSKYFGLEYWPTYDDEQSLKDVLKYMNDISE
ncbi:MAG: TIM barrel protein [Clostridiaceae bacterium]|jgi:hydroxypyruvate isomerase|nr:TIM barrel protein [Clostridiaceae bacterium]